ncbi:MAG TPA: hypothetical protein VIY47_16005, partial [Ignavibacteriaceae bacterium]
VEESFTSFLTNCDDREQGNLWLDMIDRRWVRSMKYIYQTNSKEIVIFLMKTKSEIINRMMQYGPGNKQTFYGYVESMPESKQKTEWLAILKSDQTKTGTDN